MIRHSGVNMRAGKLHRLLVVLMMPSFALTGAANGARMAESNHETGWPWFFSVLFQGLFKNFS
ncbi:hypothetical protein [Allorhizobium sonneratiae]|uniref:hypothetical protein n=1 Tax=Allorhizobium sonneratiae TaxID=2934936 RepID=UPI002033F70D|nr:hypothetical protein [Allorhizobium sonneratiae]